MIQNNWKESNKHIVSGTLCSSIMIEMMIWIKVYFGQKKNKKKSINWFFIMTSRFVYYYHYERTKLLLDRFMMIMKKIIKIKTNLILHYNKLELACLLSNLKCKYLSNAITTNNNNNNKQRKYCKHKPNQTWNNNMTMIQCIVGKRKKFAYQAKTTKHKKIWKKTWMDKFIIIINNIGDQ